MRQETKTNGNKAQPGDETSETRTPQNATMKTQDQGTRDDEDTSERITVCEHEPTTE